VSNTIIDSHQHFWQVGRFDYPWMSADNATLYRDYLPPVLEPILSESGVSQTVLVQASNSLAETRWLLELADRHPFIAGVVGWVDLQAGAVADQIEEFCRHPKFVGLRHIVQSEPDDRFLLKPSFCRGISVLEELDLAYDILIYPKHLGAAAEFVGRFPRQRFVLDHAAKPVIRTGELREWESGLRRLAEFPHVWCKLSGLVTEADWRHWTADQIRPYLDVAFEAFGPDRLMAGSDWPVCTVAADYGRTMALVREYLNGKPESVRDAVLGGNAQRFWRLTAGELV